MSGDSGQRPHVTAGFTEPSEERMPQRVKNERTHWLFLFLVFLDVLCNCLEDFGVLLFQCARLNVAAGSRSRPDPTIIGLARVFPSVL